MGSHVRSKTCQVVGFSEACPACKHTLGLLQKPQALSVDSIPPKRPLCSIPRPVLQGLVTSERQQRKAAEILAEKLREEIERGVKVKEDFNQELIKTMETMTGPSEFVQLLWEEQKKALACKPNGMRWHPMLIKFGELLKSL